MEIARKLAEQPVGLRKATAALAVVVTFGALRLGAGYNLATPERPYWIVKSRA